MAHYRFLSIILLVATAFGGCELRAEDEQDKQQRSHNIYAEFFGASNIVSVNYDRRFPGTSIFGYRAGVSFSYSLIEEGLDNICPGVAIPLGANALFGKRASKFEVGAEIIPGFYAWRDGVERYWTEDNIDHKGKIYYGPVHWTPTCKFSINLGYRLQRKKGFNFRIGLSPCIGIASDFVYFNAMSLLPYLSFGYTIP